MRKIPRARWILAALFVISATGASAQPPLTASAAPPRPFSWWKSNDVKKELGLSADQITRLDKIWETTRPELRQEWDELSRLEGKLSRMIQADADEAALSRQIDRVETARASTNKTRSLMLVQMRKTLTPEQRVRLDALHERWQQDARKTQPQGAPGQPPGSAPRDSGKSPHE